ncbi:WD repeat-containing protein 6, partial [Quaeritorhiza haematococci]
MLKSKAIQTQITALRFLSNSILCVASGPFIKLYDIRSSHLFFTYECFPSSLATRVHGIRVLNPQEPTKNPTATTSTTLAVYGGKNVCIVKLVLVNESLKETHVVSHHHLPPFRDWVLDVAWVHGLSKATSTTAIAVAFCHNIVEVWDYVDQRRLHRIQCEERCMLYCARFFGSHPNDLVCASGTIFGQVLLWKVFQDDTDESRGTLMVAETSTRGSGRTTTVLGRIAERLIGHEGVLFNIRFHPSGSHLATCSDDRTIRVWSLPTTSIVQRNQSTPALVTTTAISTGTSAETVAILYGHMARVWDCLFVGGAEGTIVSVGEDATTRVWSWKDAAETSATTKPQNKPKKQFQKASEGNASGSDGGCLAVWEGHDGKNVWCADVDPTGSVVATGGGDSGVRLWSLTSLSQNRIDSESQMHQVDLPPPPKPQSTTLPSETAPAKDTDTPTTRPETPTIPELTVLATDDVDDPATELPTDFMDTVMDDDHDQPVGDAMDVIPIVETKKPKTKKPKIRERIVKNFVVLDESRVVVLTSDGEIFLISYTPSSPTPTNSHPSSLSEQSLSAHNQVSTHLHTDVDFGNYSVMTCGIRLGDEKTGIDDVVVLGGMEGHVLIVFMPPRLGGGGSVRKPIKWKAHSSKISHISAFLSTLSNPSTPHPTLNIFIYSQPTDLYWFRVSLPQTPSLTSPLGVAQPVASFIVPDGQVVTSLSFWISPKVAGRSDEDELERKSAVVVVGARKGALIVYSVEGAGATVRGDEGGEAGGEGEKSPLVVPPAIIQPRAHGSDSVTGLAILKTGGGAGNEDNEDDDDKIESSLKRAGKNTDELGVLTCGRDGVFCRYVLRKSAEVDETSGGWKMERLYRTRLTKGWLEKVIFVDNQVLLCGFYDKRFFIYNEAKRYQMFSVACGGGHRRWDVSVLDPELRGGMFGFIRKDRLYLVFRETKGSSLFKDPKLQDNFHGLETRVVRFVRPGPRPHLRGANGGRVEGNMEGGKEIVVTGGEDSVLKFHLYDPSRTDQTLESLFDLRKHVSVIRGIAFSNALHTTLMFTAGAREELRCWKIERLHNEATASTTLGVKKEAKRMRVESGGTQEGVGGLTDLIRCLDVAAAPAVSPIPETRIMDIDAFPLSANRPNQDVHVVAAACSDGVVRVWLFNALTNTFNYIASSGAHNRCVLKVRTVVLPATQSTAPPRPLLFTTGTDGHVIAFDLSFVYHYSTRIDQPRDAEENFAVEEMKELVKCRMHQSGICGVDVGV